MRIVNYVNGVEGIATDSIATVRIPVGRRIHKIEVFATAVDGDDAPLNGASVIGTVDLSVNSVQMRYLTAIECRKIALLNSQALVDSIIPIYFSEPWRFTTTGEEAFSWDLKRQTECVLKLQILPTALSPVVKVRITYDFDTNTSIDPATGQESEFLNIMKILPVNYNAAAGQFDINTLPTNNLIHRVHMQTSTGAITSCEVYNGNVKIFEGTKVQNDASLLDYKIDGSQFSFSVIFDFDQQASSFLRPLINNFNVRPTFASNNNTKVLVEHAVNGFR